jgi:putative hemin transport protein
MTKAQRRDATALLRAWSDAHAGGLNNRAAASKLGVSEAELVASACGRFATRLRSDCRALLDRLAQLGEIKCIVRNPYAVLERAGTVQSAEYMAPGRLRLHADRFEAECQLESWRKGFALEETGAAGTKCSLQFFTAEGVSAAKFFLRPASEVQAYRELVRAFADENQSDREDVVPAAASAPVPAQRLRPAAEDALLNFLRCASRGHRPLRLRVHNGAAALVTSKVIERVKRSEKGGWVNVLDDGLNLHLHEERIRFVQALAGRAPDSGWFHWFGGQHEIALSVQVDSTWEELAQAAGVGPADRAEP